MDGESSLEQLSSSSLKECDCNDEEDLAAPPSSPRRNILAQKMKSTSAIGERVIPLNLQTDGEENVMGMMKPCGINHFRMTDLNNESDRKIEDSHTSYRKILEREITELKIKLAEAQEKADTLQNDLNRVSIDRGVLQASNKGISEKYDNTKRHCDELAAVVAHLKDNAKESSRIRRSLEERVDTCNRNYETLRRKNRQLRHENRKLRRELQNAGHDLEGRGMENQGLKSENDWLKRQLQELAGRFSRSPNNDDEVSEMGESSSDEEERVVTGIQELLSFPSAATKHYSSQKRKEPEVVVEERQVVTREGNTDGGEAVYSSFVRDKSTSISVSGRTINENSSSNAKHAGDLSKNTSKWNWWSPFDIVGAPETIDDESKVSDGLIQYPPQSSGLSTSQHNMTYAEPSAKRLVPKRLNDRSTETNLID